MCCARVSRVVHNEATRHDRMSQEADGKLQLATRRGSRCRPDLKLVLQARWQQAEAIDSVQLWCTWQLIGVRWRIRWVLMSGGVRWQDDRVEVERLIGRLPVMDRLGRTVHMTHS
jgi:hypothetical protein